MVKADLSRDYYGDLELQPDASENDIKKQFKKLALKYHPDRNPGHEAEVNSKFQTIQSAHEILTDPEQRAKYDNNLRSRGPSRASGWGNPTSGPSSGSASTPHARGNPYANAGSNWPAPPKPPPVRKTQPSPGAQKYANFQPPPTAKQQHDAAEERRRTYRAYETMRSQQPKREWQPPKPVDPKFTHQSGREESNSFKHPPPPKSSRPGFEEFRAGVPPRSSRKSTSPSSPERTTTAGPTPRRNGFMPNNPDGDEPPAANTSAYFTQRPGRAPTARQSKPPELPKRSPNLDPQRTFKEQTGTPFEERTSTPYATQGGEKTDPFENLNLNRSRSTRERPNKGDPLDMGSFSPDGNNNRRSASQPRTKPHRPTLSTEFGPSRADSDTNIGSPPKRTYPYSNQAKQGGPSRAQTRYTPTVDSESSSNDEEGLPRNQSFGNRPRVYAKTRKGRSQETPIEPGKPTSSTETNDYIPRKPSLAGFRQRELFEAAKRNVLNDLQPDGPPGTHTTSRDDGAGEKPNPSMYATPNSPHTSNSPQIIYAAVYPAGSENSTVKLSKVSTFPTVSEKRKINHNSRTQSVSTDPSATASSDAVYSLWPNLYPPKSKTPSGVLLSNPAVLNAFETTQFELLDELVVKRNQAKKLNKSTNDVTREQHDEVRFEKARSRKESQNCKSPAKFCAFSSYVFRQSSLNELGSPNKTSRFGRVSDLEISNRQGSHNVFRQYVNSDDDLKANGVEYDSFTFKVGDETFTARSRQKPFTSNSTENISTTFSPDDWHGKFQAGEDYFGSESSTGLPRTRSGSRSRGRSPGKPRRPHVNTRNQYQNIDPSIIDADKPTVSPGFSAEEWAQTFKPQTFAPPTYQPPVPSNRPVHPPRRRTRVGSSGGKPLFGSMTAGTAAMVDEDDSSDDTPLYMGQKSPRDSAASRPVLPHAYTTGSPTAMDLDPPLEAFEARNVPVEPSRPEWRAGDANGLDPLGKRSPNGRPHLPFRDTTKSGRRTTKSGDSEDFRTNLEDLKNVEPMYHPAAGLNSFSDLNSTLPFESKAASSVPISRGFASGQLELPNPPRAPKVPSIAQDAPRPTQSSWQSYLASFKAYMAEWGIFNNRMITHFVARLSQVETMPAGWIEAFGESGIEKYREGLKEDVKVREWWDVASAKHLAAVEEFMWFREVMKEGIFSAGNRPRNRTH